MHCLSIPKYDMIPWMNKSLPALTLKIVQYSLTVSPTDGRWTAWNRMRQWVSAWMREWNRGRSFLTNNGTANSQKTRSVIDCRWWLRVETTEQLDKGCTFHLNKTAVQCNTPAYVLYSCEFWFFEFNKFRDEKSDSVTIVSRSLFITAGDGTHVKSLKQLHVLNLERITWPACASHARNLPLHGQYTLYSW